MRVVNSLNQRGPLPFFRGLVGRWLTGISTFSALIGCSANTAPPASPKNQSSSYPGSFSIKEIASTKETDGTKKVWLATWVRGDQNASFRIELLFKPQKGNVPFAFTTGAFMREKSSDGLSFLTELAKVLKAKHVPKKTNPVKRLEFKAAILGMSLSRQAGEDQLAGSFTSNPPGPWISVKVFVADGEGEFFLNLNPAGGEGEISIKDEEYGDIVVRELATVMLP